MGSLLVALLGMLDRPPVVEEFKFDPENLIASDQLKKDKDSIFHHMNNSMDVLSYHGHSPEFKFFRSLDLDTLWKVLNVC